MNAVRGASTARTRRGQPFQKLPGPDLRHRLQIADPLVNVRSKYADAFHCRCIWETGFRDFGVLKAKKVSEIPAPTWFMVV